MDMILGKCKFPISFFFLFSGNICCMYTLELPHFQYVRTTYVFSINEFFTISFFFKQILNHRSEHVEMNNFSCSLSCT